MAVSKLTIVAAFLLCMESAIATPITFLEMHSQAGDYIGQGKDYLYDADDGTFKAKQAYYGNPTYLNRTVEISFIAPGYSDWWYLDFSTTRLGTNMALGTYTAQRFPFEPAGSAGMDISGNGRGSNRLSGTFTILDLAYGQNGTVDRFAATFEQHSEYSTKALTGRVSYNSEAFSPAAIPEPAALFPLGFGLLMLATVVRRRFRVAR